jgi:hypothetical protein
MFEEMAGRYKGVRPRPRPQSSGPSRHVLLLGAVFNRDDKEPFDASGFSLLGALEYDQNTDSVKCHECGEFRVKLGGMHLSVEHSMTAKNYRLKHGLCRKTPLRGLFGIDRESIERIKIVRHAPNKERFRQVRMEKIQPDLSIERRNVANKCRSQLLQRLRNLRNELGYTPRSVDLRDAGLFRVLDSVFDSVAAALRLAGMEPRTRGQSLSRPANLLPANRTSDSNACMT